MDIQNLKQRYLEYKDTLQKIEEGDYETLKTTTIWQYETMKKIVEVADDIGFGLIARKTN